MGGIMFLSGHSYSTGGALSQQKLDSALKHGPVVIGVQWSLGGGHAITISGGSGGNYKGLTTYRPPYAQGRYTGKWFGSAYTNSGADVADIHIPRGLVIENATEAEMEIARSRQFEKDFEEGNYKSDLDVTRGMTNCNQECSNWCWATSATMAASAFGGGSQCNSEEAKVAGHEFHTSCSGSCSTKCNQGG